MLACSSVAVHAPVSLAKNTQPKILTHEKLSTPIYIQDNWSPSPVLNNQDIIWAYLNHHKNRFHIQNDAKNHFYIKQKQTDEQGQSHFRLQQIHQKIPVFGSDQTIHLNKQNHITSYFGQFTPLSSKKVNTKAKLNQQQALQIAQKTLKIKKFPPRPQVELMIYPDQKRYTLAYIIKISLLSPPAYWHMVIDAQSGKVIKKQNVIQHITGKGKGVLGDSKKLEVHCKNNQSSCQLEDKKRKIYTYDAENNEYSSNQLPGKIITSSNTTFHDPAGVDAHAYAAKVYDYFYTKFKRKSYDNQGASIISSVHVGERWNNAAWNGKQMLYGDGDDDTFINLAGALDVIGHEITHAVTEKTANLQYFGESGALNESISDIFGATIEAKNWLIGEDVYTPNIAGDALRSMSDPTDYAQPDHYRDLYIGMEDNGGVHINSGINNKAAYLIAVGGTHDNIQVKGIGKDKMAKIYYHALTKYLTSSAQFSQMRRAVIHSTQDLYGANSNEVKTVTKAYDAIGVK